MESMSLGHAQIDSSKTVATTRGMFPSEGAEVACIALPCLAFAQVGAAAPAAGKVLDSTSIAAGFPLPPLPVASLPLSRFHLGNR